jgi:hypothetical protein
MVDDMLCCRVCFYHTESVAERIHGRVFSKCHQLVKMFDAFHLRSVAQMVNLAI